MKYNVIYQDVILFTANSKQEAIDAITTYVTKRGLKLDSKRKIFGKIILSFYDNETSQCYIYTIIRE